MTPGPHGPEKNMIMSLHWKDKSRPWRRVDYVSEFIYDLGRVIHWFTNAQACRRPCREATIFIQFVDLVRNRLRRAYVHCV